MKKKNLLLSPFFLKSWQARVSSNTKADHYLSPVQHDDADPNQFLLPATTLKRPPSPFYLFINHAQYRKWVSSKALLKFSLILPSRFKDRMRKRIIKHQGAASRIAQRRDAVIAQLTVPARKIFLELEALYANCSKFERKT